MHKVDLVRYDSGMIGVAGLKVEPISENHAKIAENNMKEARRAN